MDIYHFFLECCKDLEKQIKAFENVKFLIFYLILDLMKFFVVKNLYNSN